MFSKLRTRRQSSAADDDIVGQRRPRRGSNATTRTTTSRTNIFAYLSSSSSASPPAASASTTRLDRPSTSHVNISASRPSFANSLHSTDGSRPKTSDGLGHTSRSPSETSVSLTPPVLPPIPRVAERYSRFLLGEGDMLSLTGTILDPAKSEQDQRPDPAQTGKENMASSTKSDKAPAVSVKSPNAPMESKMEATMFPSSEILPFPTLDRHSEPENARAFVDSRDKSYYPMINKAPRIPSRGPAAVETDASSRLPVSSNANGSSFTRSQQHVASQDNLLPSRPREHIQTSFPAKDNARPPPPAPAQGGLNSFSKASPSAKLGATPSTIVSPASPEHDAKDKSGPRGSTTSVSPMSETVSPLSQHHDEPPPHSSVQSDRRDSPTDDTLLQNSLTSSARGQLPNGKPNVQSIHPAIRPRLRDDVSNASFKGSPGDPVSVNNDVSNIFNDPLLSIPNPSPAHHMRSSHNSSLRSSNSDPSLTRASVKAASDASETKRSAKTKALFSASPVSSGLTIGTPYQDTSSVFPLPQHVTTRPNDATDTANIAGVTVPTHVSKGHKSSGPESVRSFGKRRTRFLNPMALLGRKRDAQDSEPTYKASLEERSASAQAFAKQRSVAVSGVEKLPANFDPTIRGKGVHDFSTPRRATRTFSQDMDSPTIGTAGFGSSPDRPSHYSHISDTASRRSVHSPVFREHLSDDGSDEQRASSVNAERLESKQLMQRTSAVANDLVIDGDFSAFVRRSQRNDAPFAAGPNRARDERKKSVPHVSTMGIPSIVPNGQVEPAAVRHAAAVPQRADMSANNHTLSILTGGANGYQQHPARAGLGIVPVADETSNRRPDGYDVQTMVQQNRSDDRAQSQKLRLQQDALATPPEQFPSFEPNSTRDSSQNKIVTQHVEVWSHRSSSLPTPEYTPDQFTHTRNPQSSMDESSQRLGEKRASAAGHSRRASTRQHRVSNASRFSFQLGGSAEEEEALEEKHRRNSERPEGAVQTSFNDDGDDDDDYFDEDAMNDMDEMEMQGQDIDEVADRFRRPPVLGINTTAEPSLNAQQHSAQHSSQHARVRSDSSILTVNTNLVMRTPTTATFSSPIEPPRFPIGYHTMTKSSSGLKQVENASQSSPPAASPPSFTLQKPPMPRQSSEKSLLTTRLQSQGAIEGNSTGNRNDFIHTATFGSASAPLLQPRGFNFGDFSDFRFADEPDFEVPGHSGLPPAPQMSLSSGANMDARPRLGIDTKCIPSRSSTSTSSRNEESAPYYGRVGQGIRARNAATQPNSQYDHEQQADDYDDMYFDDGGFEQDTQQLPVAPSLMNEDAFDDPEYLERLNDHHRKVQAQAASAFSGEQDNVSNGSNASTDSSITSNTRPVVVQSHKVASKDPYQSLVARKWIPHRNPSENAKRHLQDHMMPPFPINPQDVEAMERMQNNLDAYHAALANAANKAAAQGRFARKPSVTGFPSMDAFASALESMAYGQFDGRGVEKTQPDMFDFEFDDEPTDDAGYVDDDDVEDDDIIAAANAEVLASDNEGFYGQEFGFYAKARPDSSHAEAVNGGFFGELGDDGLTRNKSLREPNLTPITERSEFSTRNSFINTGHGLSGAPLSAGLFGPSSPGFGRWAISALPEHEITTFDDLRRLRASAFGGSNDGSIHSSEGKGTGPRPLSSYSPTLSTRSGAPNSAGGLSGPPVTLVQSNDSSGSSSNGRSNQVLSNSTSQLNVPAANTPQSTVSSPATFFAGHDLDATPRKASDVEEAPTTARKMTGKQSSHSRTGSDSITYIHEPGTPQQPPRWVLERRRTSEQGHTELVEREIVPSGWI